MDPTVEFGGDSYEVAKSEHQAPEYFSFEPTVLGITTLFLNWTKEKSKGSMVWSEITPSLKFEFFWQLIKLAVRQSALAA